MSTADQYRSLARESVMHERLNDHVRECHERAAEARAKADASDNATLKADFLDLERRWLTLARSYGFSGSLEDFTAANAVWPRKIDEGLRGNGGSLPATTSPDGMEQLLYLASVVETMMTPL